MKLEDIKSVKVHWSESVLINNRLGCDGCSGAIEKEITPNEADQLIKDAAQKVGPGYDKTKMTVHFHREQPKGWNEVKFYITKGTTGLLDLIRT